MVGLLSIPVGGGFMKTPANQVTGSVRADVVIECRRQRAMTPAWEGYALYVLLAVAMV